MPSRVPRGRYWRTHNVTLETTIHGAEPVGYVALLLDTTGVINQVHNSLSFRSLSS
jgi:hypothetical protein